LTLQHIGPNCAGVAPRRAWSVAAFRRIWVATVLMSIGVGIEGVVIGFFVLDRSGDVFLTAATFAVRAAPGLVVAPIAGALADQWPRARLFGIVAAYRALVVTGLVVLVASGADALWAAFMLTAASGIGMALDTPTTQGLVTDSVPRPLRMNAVATQSIGKQSIGALAALASGLVIDRLGSATALAIAVTSYALAAGASLLVPAAQAPNRRFARWWALPARSYADLRALLGIANVRGLLAVALVVEIFGFAYVALLPVLARDVLAQAGTGLGALTMVKGFGSLIGVVLLALLGNFTHKAHLLAAITLLFGFSLVALGSSTLYPLSLVIIALVGMAAGTIDPMQWTLLQDSVPEDTRGRAIGGWAFAAGFGWIGALGLGALSTAIGVRWTLAAAGTLVLATGALIWPRNPDTPKRGHRPRPPRRNTGTVRPEVLQRHRRRRSHWR
jgi:MFS family permease